MAETTVQFKLYHDGPTAGRLDCWVTPPVGPTTSFEPAQLPESLATVLGPTLTAALATHTALQAQVAELQAQVAALQGGSPGV